MNTSVGADHHGIRPRAEVMHLDAEPPGAVHTKSCDTSVAVARAGHNVAVGIVQDELHVAEAGAVGRNQAGLARHE